MRFFLFFLFIFSQPSWSSADTETEAGFFSGRISKINRAISTVRIKIDFDNVKYINPKDKIEFWDEKNSTLKCKSYVVGRTADYILLKVNDIKFCESQIYFTTGAYYKFFSEDLVNNIKMGKEVVSILLKKRLAVNGQMEMKTRDLQGHVERVDTVNARYQALRAKLEQEWQLELHALDEDRSFALKAYKDLERRRDEIDQKLEQYKLRDDNLTLDRWSLDSNLYFKK